MKVLVCADGSESSLYAIKKARPFLMDCEDINLVYVIDDAFLAHFAQKEKIEIISAHEDSAKAVIDKTSEFIESLNCKVNNKYILKGKPPTEIIKLAKKENPEIIIIGTNSKIGLERWLGSVSREVIMNSSCPLFLAQNTHMGTVYPKRVLVTVNDSECSYHAINEMIKTINLQNASIEILTVIHSPESVPSELVMDDDWLKEFMQKEREKAKNTLAKAKSIFEDNKIDVKDTFCLEGFVAQEIMTYLDDNPKDIVVIGTHGRDEITSFLLGSVSRRVLDHSMSPVLIVPNRINGKLV